MVISTFKLVLVFWGILFITVVGIKAFEGRNTRF